VLRLDARSTWSPSPSGPPVEGVDDVLKPLSQGGKVPVVYPPGVELGGELGQHRRPGRPLGCGGHRHFLDDGHGPVDLHDPVDDLDGGAPGRGRTGEFPGPVPT
jgi:hypothetical protein